MQLSATHKHIGDLVAAMGTLSVYVGTFSEIVTIAVGLVTFVWFSLRVFQLLTPKRYARMQGKLDLKEKDDA
jgi:hypothetical protein